MSDTAAPSPMPPSPKPTSWWVWLVVSLCLAALIAYAVVTFRHMKTSSQLEKYAPAPEFTFTDQEGKTISTHDLKGKVWVANFIFTRCKGPCPIMTSRMATLNDLLGPGVKDVQLVSITVDPEYDSPAVLKAYGDRVGATEDRWKFLTGPGEQVKNVITKGFWQALSKDSEGMPVHSTWFVLVDRDGIIRGYQEGNDPDVASKLQADIKSLLRE